MAELVAGALSLLVWLLLSPSTWGKKINEKPNRSVMMVDTRD